MSMSADPEIFLPLSLLVFGLPLTFLIHQYTPFSENWKLVLSVVANILVMVFALILLNQSRRDTSYRSSVIERSNHGHQVSRMSRVQPRLPPRLYQRKDLWI